MTDAIEDHKGTVSTGGRTITDLRFADDIDGLAGGKRTGKFSSVSTKPQQPRAWRSVPRRQADDKQHKWYQHRDQSKWTEA